MRSIFARVLGLAMLAIVLTGCVKSTSSSTPATAGASATASGAGKKFSDQPLQAELQKYLIERAKKNNSGISDDAAWSQMEQDFKPFAQHVFDECIWSDLNPPNRKLGEPSPELKTFGTAMAGEHLDEFRKMRLEFEISTPWIDDLIKDCLANPKMAQPRQDMARAVFMVEAQRLQKKLEGDAPKQ